MTGPQLQRRSRRGPGDRALAELSKAINVLDQIVASGRQLRQLARVLQYIERASDLLARSEPLADSHQHQLEKDLNHENRN